MKINDAISLVHPCRSTNLTLVGDKIWVTGGNAYESHFSDWGKGKYVKFTGNPNIQVIDLATQSVKYLGIGGGKDYYKSTAFTTSPDAKIIYLAANQKLAKVDTEKGTFTKLATIGEPGERTKGSWGYMNIKGKKYVVLVTEDKQISFFDPDAEKFVKIPGVKSEVPNASAFGSVVDNKFYIFGGNASGDDNGGPKAFVFDPSLPEADQLKPIADLPIPLAVGAAAAVNGKIYLMGGGSDGDFVATVFEYDPATNKYVRKTDLPRGGTNNNAAVVKGDTIYMTYAYAWGTAAEGKLGFRIHPSAVVEYKPALDKVDQPYSTKTSISGNFLNITLTWPDANKIVGPDQTLAINWWANTASTGGNLFYRVKGAEKFETLAAKATKFDVGMTSAVTYRVILTGLKPKTNYEYYVTAEGKTAKKSELYTFITQAAVAPSTYQAFIYGDTKAEYHIGNEVNGAVYSKIQESRAAGLNPMFLTQLGDFGSVGAPMEYEAWFNYGRTKNYTQPMMAQFPFLAIHGNHEGLLPTFYNSFAFPSNGAVGYPDTKGSKDRWYSFTIGKAHYIVFTTGEYLAESWYSKEQLEWFKKELEVSKQMKAAGKINWTIVMTHTNFFTTSEHFLDIDAQGMHNPGNILDAIENSKTVDLVLTAHDHDYERTKAISGYRWFKEKDGKTYYKKTDKAYTDPNSGAFGETKQGNGVVYMVIGTAGAGQRDMFTAKQVGDLSWLASRKPEPDRGETAGTDPAYGYAVMTVTNKELKVEVYEKSMKPMGSDGAIKPILKDVTDDIFEGLLDRITIKK